MLNKNNKIAINNHALLVVDVVNGCCDEKFEKYDNKFNKVRTMIPTRLIPFIKWYKQNTNGLVIYINIVKWIKKYIAHNVSKLYDENPEVEYYDDPKNTSEAIKFYKVKPESNDIIITKNTYDAFAMPEMKKVINEYEIQNLIITGVYGIGCVNSTINGAFSNGLSMIMIDDLIESMDHSQALQKQLKQNWVCMFGPVIPAKKITSRVISLK